MDRTVLITGATRGVGRGIADAFARRGDRLVLVARSTDASPNKVGLPGTLESVAAELRELGSVDVHTITADLVQTPEAERVVHEVRASWGTPDVLVNNAAATFIGEFLDIPVSRWKTALGLNLLAPVALIHGFLPDMLERDAGRIVNITSAAARTRDLPSKDVPQLSYAASKAALDAFSYGLMHDLADTGVALDLVAPVVLTESVEYHLTGERFDALKQRMAPMGAFGEAVARIADQPSSFRGNYLENHDLEALGFLVRQRGAPRVSLRAMAIEQFPIEAGHVLMFARAIGDPNPVYADADVAASSEVGAVPAPPTFVTASAQFDPDYPLRPKPGQPWFGSGREATGATPTVPSGGKSEDGGGGGTSLHAEQHYEYHRPLVVGDVLHARGRKGETWEKQGRSGTLKFTELITEYLDADDEVVITARTVAVLTEGPK